jgi:hypothetical protein
MAEKRASPRQAERLSLHIASEPQGRFEIETLNVSLSGAYCRSRYFLPLMTRLRVSMVLPEERGARTLATDAVVVRVDPSGGDGNTGTYDLALYFTHMEPAAQEHLSHFLRRQSGGGKGVAGK